MNWLKRYRIVSRFRRVHNHLKRNLDFWQHRLGYEYVGMLRKWLESVGRPKTLPEITRAERLMIQRSNK